MTILKVFRVKSIAGLGIMKPFTVISIGEEPTLEVVAQNLSSFKVKFEDEQGRETPEYFVRPIKRIGVK